ncbi:P-loop containing nucleoside triphosphate hydrolase protein [Hysterangium stoloniferum]|nr:P-loop containing nucleoside triphosphate hydrolase protein [Hysterangium stoloniferum]
MSSFFTSLLSWLSSLLFSKNAEICIVGLQASGKTSMVNVIGANQFSEEVVPTVAFNLRHVKRGGVKLKVWDVAGQPKFRSTWQRYCSGVDAVVFVVDSSDRKSFQTANFELHSLLAQSTLSGTPLLVLGNKNDLPDHANIDELIKALYGLDKITNRPVSCYSCSMKSQHNLDIVLKWLADRGH